MTLWNGSFPFYAGTNACFPFNTTSAVIASVFLSALATSIIILPGIRGKGVSGGAGRAQPHAGCTPCATPSLPLQQTPEQMCPWGRGLLMARAVGSPASPEDKLQPSSHAGLHNPKFTGSPDLSLASSRLDLA